MWLKCIWSRIDTQTCVAGVFKRSHSNVLPICIFDESWTSVGYSKLSTTNITLSCDCSTITRGNAFYFSFLKCNITFVCVSMTFLNIIPCSLIPTFWKVINNLSLLEHQSKVKVWINKIEKGKYLNSTCTHMPLFYVAPKLPMKWKLDHHELLCTFHYKCCSVLQLLCSHPRISKNV